MALRPDRRHYVTDLDQVARPKPRRDKARMPENSIFYGRIIPLLLLSLAVIMVALIVVAAGVLLGFIPFR
jgi:hypothetical protein